jgi:head-tail adaptor
MSYLAPKLKHRIQIKQLSQSTTAAGGMSQDYTLVTTVWASMSEVRVGFENFVTQIRGTQTDDVETHEFMIRLAAVKNLGRGFASGFSSGLDGIADLTPLKSDYYIFLQKGSTTKGRLFKIMRVRRDENLSEFIKIRCKEIEEQGTGY